MAAQSCASWFASGASKWEEPQDTAMALIEPHCYSWRLFLSLNWPADIPAKAPNQNAAFGADGPVVWETWRNANNRAPDTAFPPDGTDPGEWLAPPAVSMVELPLSPEDALPLQQLERIRTMGGSNAAIPTFDVDSALFSINETRLNKETYEFIRENELYNLDGQKDLFESGAVDIVFPAMAKEIKAQWRKISETDKPRYHWATHTEPDGTVTIFGLTALHITTKDLPNWLWATFEHIDNKLPEDAGGRPGNEGWKLPSVDKFACPASPHDCEGIPENIGLQGTKWENYRLRGAQTDFIDSRGNITLLANSQPEQGFQMTSSCISCHARASVNGDGDRLEFFKPNGEGFVGPPDPAAFGDAATGNRSFTQLDFVWSFFRARPRQP
ncbi:hypothetical protein MesoLjLb_02280 [Mesorhizobium sp. L-8-3]|nr:hypothetical protein MesoLjLb_02280 [Mesorhizobium sp. L-8-3]